MDNWDAIILEIMREHGLKLEPLDLLMMEASPKLEDLIKENLPHDLLKS